MRYIDDLRDEEEEVDAMRVLIGAGEEEEEEEEEHGVVYSGAKSTLSLLISQ